jgi:hypothetical protein
MMSTRLAWVIWISLAFWILSLQLTNTRLTESKEPFSKNTSQATKIELKSGNELRQSMKLPIRGLQSVRLVYHTDKLQKDTEMKIIITTKDNQTLDEFIIDANKLTYFTEAELELNQGWNDVDKGEMIEIIITTNTDKGVWVYSNNNSWFEKGLLLGELKLNGIKKSGTLVFEPIFDPALEKADIIKGYQELIRFFIEYKNQSFGLFLLWVVILNLGISIANYAPHAKPTKQTWVVWFLVGVTYLGLYFRSTING